MLRFKTKYFDILILDVNRINEDVNKNDTANLKGLQHETYKTNIIIILTLIMTTSFKTRKKWLKRGK